MKTDKDFTLGIITPIKDLEEVSIHELEDEESEIIGYLEENNEVIIWERLESMSLIEVVVTEDDNVSETKDIVDLNEIESLKDEPIIGYVNNDFIEVFEDDDSTTDTEIESEDEDSSEIEIESEDEDSSEIEIESEDEDSSELEIQSEDEDSSEIEIESEDEDSSEIEIESEDEDSSEIESEDEVVNPDNDDLSISKVSMAKSVATGTLFSGVALKNKTHVYSNQSRNSNVLKSYSQGRVLKYRSLNNNWYSATVYLDGKATAGFIHTSDVDNIVDEQTSIYGIALKAPTHIYSSVSTESKSLKSYSKNSILKFSAYTENWYKTGVFINGKKHTGFIHKSHVEKAVTESEKVALRGIALKSPTHVYTSASTDSASRKSYSKDSVLMFSTFSKDWYQTGVYVNGKKKTGYIHKSHVETGVPISESVSLKGVALKSPTHVYSGATTNSASRKSYNVGSTLKFSTFTKDWYRTGVFINGKKKTGYIHKSHVDTEVSDSKSYRGIPVNSTTKVYANTSTTSNVLKTYKQGTVISYESFTNEWYKTTISINGKNTNGFIHKDDIENAVDEYEIVQKYAKKSPMNVYQTPNSNSKVIKNYKLNSKLSIRTFTKDWYEARVRVSGEFVIGYIHKNDISSNKVNVPPEPEKPNPIDKTEYTDYGITLEQALDIQMSQKTIITDKYKNAPAYVSADYLELTGKGTITGSGVNIRTKPNTTSDIAFQLSKGSSITILEEVTGTNVSGSTLWYAISHNKKTYYVHSSLAVGSEAIATGNVNVRAGKGTNHHIFGKLTKGQKVNIVSQGGPWHQISYGTWRNPKREDMKAYLDPNKNDKFQHLRLDSSVGVSASELNKVLKGKGVLEGQGQAFINGGKKFGANEIYLISHAFLESGNGTSTLAKGVEVGKNKSGKLVRVTASNRKNLTAIKTTYNMFGIGAIDSDPLNGGAITAYKNGWFTPAAAIEGGAEWIRGQYTHNQYKQNTLYKMKWNPQMNNGAAWKQYATDIGWAVKQTTQMKNMYKMLDNPSYHYDIARYK